MGKLCWYEVFHCQYCGNTIEIDGDDGIPQHYRDLIVKGEGMWALEVTGNHAHQPTLCHRSAQWSGTYSGASICTPCSLDLPQTVRSSRARSVPTHIK